MTAFITLYLILRYGIDGAHKVMDKKLEELKEEPGKLTNEESLKQLAIPQSDIDRLETARVALCKLAEGTPLEAEIHFRITDIMYYITHMKYKKVSRVGNAHQ